MLGTLFKSKLIEPKYCTYDGEDRDEVILYVFRRSFITNLDWMFVALLLFLVPPTVNTILAISDTNTSAIAPPIFLFIVNVFWYLFTFGYIFQNFLNWFFNVYILTNKKILDVDFIGFLYKNVSEAPITSVEDVTSNVTGTFRVLFNIGSVFIQTAGQKREFEFTDVANPSLVRDIISDYVSEVKKHKEGGHK